MPRRDIKRGLHRVKRGRRKRDAAPAEIIVRSGFGCFFFVSLARLHLVGCGRGIILHFAAQLPLRDEGYEEPDAGAGHCGHYEKDGVLVKRGAEEGVAAQSSYAQAYQDSSRPQGAEVDSDFALFLFACLLFQQFPYCPGVEAGVDYLALEHC